MRPTPAAAAEPMVNNALGSPARLVAPSMSWASSAPHGDPGRQTGAAEHLRDDQDDQRAFC